jgi:predicted nucleic acid-binding protein
MEVMFDTNVILDFLLFREPWLASARAIIKLAAAKEFDAYISSSAFTDIYYITRREKKDAALTKRLLSGLRLAVSIHEASEQDCWNALISPISDLEDAVVANCAERHKLDYIITRNTKDFSCSSVPAITPGEFMGKHFAEHQQ